MKTSNIKFAGILLLGFLVVTALEAQPRYGERGSGQGMARLDLTEEQQEELTTLRTEHYKEITPLRNKMAELKARERTLLSEEIVDVKAVEKNIDEQTALLNTMRKLQTKHQLAVKDILSDEQVMKLQQGRQSRGEGYHERYGRSGARGKQMHRGERIDRNFRYHRAI